MPGDVVHRATCYTLMLLHLLGVVPMHRLPGIRAQSVEEHRHTGCSVSRLVGQSVGRLVGAMITPVAPSDAWYLYIV
jgi:hypothetical protein